MNSIINRFGPCEKIVCVICLHSTLVYLLLLTTSTQCPSEHCALWTHRSCDLFSVLSGRHLRTDSDLGILICFSFAPHRLSSCSLYHLHQVYIWAWCLMDISIVWFIQCTERDGSTGQFSFVNSHLLLFCTSSPFYCFLFTTSTKCLSEHSALWTHISFDVVVLRRPWFLLEKEHERCALSPSFVDIEKHRVDLFGVSLPRSSG